MNVSVGGRCRILKRGEDAGSSQFAATAHLPPPAAALRADSDERRIAALNAERLLRRGPNGDFKLELARVLQRFEDRKRRQGGSIRSASFPKHHQRDGCESPPPKRVARRDPGPRYRPGADPVQELLDINEADLRARCAGKPLWTQGLLDECAKLNKHLKTNRRSSLKQRPFMDDLKRTKLNFDQSGS